MSDVVITSETAPVSAPAPVAELAAASAFATRSRADCMMAPTELRRGFEVSVHNCPKIMLRELKHVFPAQFQTKSIKTAAMLAVLTCQKSLMDLSQFGIEADKEKDRLLEAFVVFAQFVTSKLIEQKYWADFIDPCSGLPMLTLPSNKVYSEVDGVELLLRYRCLSAGMCKILLHPTWGAAVYPASLFTDAPYDVVRGVLLSFADSVAQDPAVDATADSGGVAAANAVAQQTPDVRHDM